MVASDRSKRENRETNKPWVKRVPRLRRKSNSSHGLHTLNLLLIVVVEAILTREEVMFDKTFLPSRGLRVVSAAALGIALGGPGRQGLLRAGQVHAARTEWARILRLQGVRELAGRRRQSD